MDRRRRVCDSIFHFLFFSFWLLCSFRSCCSFSLCFPPTVHHFRFNQFQEGMKLSVVVSCVASNKPFCLVAICSRFLCSSLPPPLACGGFLFCFFFCFFFLFVFSPSSTNQQGTYLRRQHEEFHRRACRLGLSHPEPALWHLLQEGRSEFANTQRRHQSRVSVTPQTLPFFVPLPLVPVPPSPHSLTHACTTQPILPCAGQAPYWRCHR